MRNAYHENLTLKTSYKSFEGSIVEYLVTVNVAQELIKWNEAENHTYSISLEFDLIEFGSAAFQTTIEMIDLWDSKITAPQDKTVSLDDTGRLDIAIFGREDESKCAIEAKGINPSYNKVGEDLERLAKLLTKTNGEPKNSIENCYSISLWYRGGSNRTSHENGLERTKQSVRDQLKTQVDTVVSKYAVKIEEHVFDIVRATSRGLNKLVIETYDQAAEETGNIFGVILKLERK